MSLKVLGRRFRAVRVASGFSDVDTYAEVLELEPSEYLAIEAGQVMPMPKTFKMVSRITGHSIAFLVTGEDEHVHAHAV